MSVVKKQKINIMHLKANYAKEYGPAGLMSLIANNIDLKRFSIVLVSLQRPGVEESVLFDSAENSNVKTDIIRWKGLKSLITASFKLSSLIKKYNIHVVHTHDLRANAVGIIGGRLAGCAVAAHAHGWLGDHLSLHGRIYEFIDRKIVRFADRIIAGSEYMKEMLVSLRIPPWKIRAIYNTVDIERFKLNIETETIKRRLGLDTHCKVVGMVGRLNPEKGHRYFLEAAKEVIAVFKDVRFLIVGEGLSMNELKQYAKELGISRHVVFAGHYDDIRHIYALLDIFVLSSLKESLPLVLLEAMSAGNSIVTTDVGGIPEVIKDGQNGLVVSAKDSAGMSRAILTLLKDQNLADKLGLAGQELIKEKFSLETLIHEIEDCYEGMV